MNYLTIFYQFIQFLIKMTNNNKNKIKTTPLKEYFKDYDGSDDFDKAYILNCIQENFKDAKDLKND